MAVLDPKDLRIDTYTQGFAAGGVVVTHLPTGIVARADWHRSGVLKSESAARAAALDRAARMVASASSHD